MLINSRSVTHIDKNITCSMQNRCKTEKKLFLFIKKKKNLYKNGKTLTFYYIRASQSTDMCNMFTYVYKFV